MVSEKHYWKHQETPFNIYNLHFILQKSKTVSMYMHFEWPFNFVKCVNIFLKYGSMVYIQVY